MGTRSEKMNRFEKIATAISNSCDKHGFDLSEAEIDLIAKDLLRSKAFGSEITVDEVEQGEVFKWGEKDYIKLDTLTDGCLCLARDIWFRDEFDYENKNNWAKSSLRQKLAEVIGDYAIKSKLVPFYRDLTTDDGLADYGHCTDTVSMLTCDEYRKYRKFIPKIDEWYWTITAYTVCNDLIRYVSSDGSLYNCSAYYADNGGIGVRPLICLDNGTLVEVQNGEDKG